MTNPARDESRDRGLLTRRCPPRSAGRECVFGGEVLDGLVGVGLQDRVGLVAGPRSLHQLQGEILDHHGLARPELILHALVLAVKGQGAAAGLDGEGTADDDGGVVIPAFEVGGPLPVRRPDRRGAGRLVARAAALLADELIATTEQQRRGEEDAGDTGTLSIPIHARETTHSPQCVQAFRRSGSGRRQSTPNGSRMSLRRAMSPATVPEAVVIRATGLLALPADGLLGPRGRCAHSPCRSTPTASMLSSSGGITSFAAVRVSRFGSPLGASRSKARRMRSRSSARRSA